MGQLAASITHEVNQPLAAIVNNADACLNWLAANNLEEARESCRAGRLAEQLWRGGSHRTGSVLSSRRRRHGKITRSEAEQSLR